MRVLGVFPATRLAGLGLVYGAAIAGWSYLVSWGLLHAVGLGECEIRRPDRRRGRGSGRRSGGHAGPLKSMRDAHSGWSISGLRLPCRSKIAALRCRSYSVTGSASCHWSERRDRLVRVGPQRGVAEQEVEGRARDGPFPGRGLEQVGLLLAAALANDLEVVGKVGVGRVPAEAVALALAGEEVVQVPAHRLGVVEPGLADDVLAVVGLELLDGGLGRGGRAKSLALLVDPSRLLDQLRGVELVQRVDAPNLPVGLEVDPGVELGRRAVARPLAMRLLEQGSRARHPGQVRGRRSSRRRRSDPRPRRSTPFSEHASRTSSASGSSTGP